MLSDRKGVVLAMVALLAITSAIPLAGASTITAVISPSTGSANVTAYVNTTATIRTNSTGLFNLTSFIVGISDRNSSITLSSGSEIFGGMQAAIENNVSSARLTYLHIDANVTSHTVNSDEIVVNHTMKLVMNVTGIYDNGTINMAWRGFSDNRSVQINSVDFNNFEVSGVQVGTYHSLNFSAFSKPLNDWTRTYNAAANTTTFYTDAGYTLNYTSDMHTSGMYLNITVKSDPAYSIVTPGYATASGDSITLSSPPNSLTPYLYYVMAVVIIALGIGVSLSVRRRKKS